MCSLSIKSFFQLETIAKAFDDSQRNSAYKTVLETNEICYRSNIFFLRLCFLKDMKVTSTQQNSRFHLPLVRL